jgi:Uma2 family endonuclease
MMESEKQLLELLSQPGKLDEDVRGRMLAALVVGSQPRRVSYEEFLAWADEDTLAEWVDGEVIVTSPSSYRHQDLVRFLLGVMGGFVETFQLGVVQSAPFQMKLEKSGREPDLLFLAEAHRGRLRTTYLDGPADLVVEILSPESVGRDRGEKFYEYEAAGLPEYWLVDPQVKRAEFYQLDPAGQYQLIPLEEGVYRARQIPGFWLKTDWLWQSPLPLIQETLLEVGGEAYARRLIERLRQGGYLT